MKYKYLLTKIPSLIFTPKKYFDELFLENKITFKDVAIFCFPIISIIIILQFYINKDRDSIEKIVYIIGLLTGLLVSILFRIYFLSSYLVKNAAIQIETKNIGLIVFISLIPNLLLSIPAILIHENQFTFFINSILYIWSLIIILIGIMSLTKISYTKATQVIITIAAFELLIKFAFTGIDF